MATMISEVYEAFRSAGVPDDKARAAAEALSADHLATQSDIAKLERVTVSEIARLEAATRSDVAKLERVTVSEIARLEAATRADINKLQLETTSEFARLEAGGRADSTRLERELVVIKWMLGLVIVAIVVPLVRPFFG